MQTGKILTGRIKLIAFTARLVNVIIRLPAGPAIVSICQTVWPIRSFYAALLVYRRPFATLQEASDAVAPYTAGGHENSHNVDLHLTLSARPRPSDYSALFHLQPLAPRLHTIFDLGGNVGNLYYSYSKYLSLPPDLTWKVKDLPANMAAGQTLAAQRDAQPLSFTSDWSQASNADLLIVSGSLHYMKQPLPGMIAQLPIRPKRILINRTPLTDGPPVATIQDAGDFRIACMLYNRAEFIQALEALDYIIVDQWPASELSMDIPGYPQHKIWAYTGIFLRHKSLLELPA